MNRLRDLREDKELYQKDIAKILSMSQTGYYQYETETNDIPTDILKQLAIFYNTSIDYILGLTNLKNPILKMINNNIKRQLRCPFISPKRLHHIF